ncbi:MAG: hypothetical protein ACEPOV_06270 [Hyphomicrobiales bacterium]
MKLIKYIVYLVCFVPAFMFVKVQFSDDTWGMPLFYNALIVGVIFTIITAIMDARKAKRSREKKV